ncbi:MAG TPA: permease prefix domain 1-containing protein [Acidimicrobiia bacterium]|nr:permease prefix domain 1-containing protein [Acidimicrobiia bacterium]
MARYALIDGYLETMRSRIRWRSDLDDVVAEMEDHLYSTTEGLCARGFDGLDAQRATLARFGDPEVLQAAFASNHRGGIAMPTTFTKQAGNLALIAAGAWAAALALIALSTWRDPGESLPLYVATVVAVSIAGSLGLVAMVGLSSRLGGLGVIGMTGLAVTGLGVVVAFVLTWAFAIWMAIQGIGMLMLALAARPSAEVPQVGLLAMGSGFILGTIAFAVANIAEVGHRDEFGDYPVAWFIGAAVGFTILALGLAIVGRWLAGEEPADIDAPPVAAH